MLSQVFKKATNPQSKSPFFSRLPLEVRLQIYQEVISSRKLTKRIHIIQVRAIDPETRICRLSNRYMSTPCVVPIEDEDQPSYHPSAHKRQCSFWRAGQKLPSKARFTSLAVFLTSQQSYLEAIPLLYSSYVFRFECWNTAVQFLSSLPAQCLNAIRVLHLCGTVPNAYIDSPPEFYPADPHLRTSDSGNEPVWLELCAKLTSLNLQTLRIDIFKSTDTVYFDESRMLQPLFSVGTFVRGNPVQFVVHMPIPNGLSGYHREQIIQSGLDQETARQQEDGCEIPFRVDRRPWELQDDVDYGSQDHGSATIESQHGRRKRWWKWIFLPVRILLYLVTMLMWEIRLLCGDDDY